MITKSACSYIMKTCIKTPASLRYYRAFNKKCCIGNKRGPRKMHQLQGQGRSNEFFFRSR